MIYAFDQIFIIIHNLETFTTITKADTRNSMYIKKYFILFSSKLDEIKIPGIAKFTS